MKFLNLSMAAFLVFLLTACGGGGGGGSSTPEQPSNNSPTVNISGVVETESGDIVSLIANATDSDGSIASYTWSSDAVSIDDANKAQASFIAPYVDNDRTISLSVTATDNKGATTRATKEITVKKKESLFIIGLVLDGGVIPNADVTFTVGDSTFATKANAAGQYSITITAGNKNLNIPVVATAVGDSTKPSVKLVSQLYSISKLIEQAGSDKTLDAQENLSVNISNVTTAEYALLKTPTYWGFNTPLATDEQLQGAQNSIGSSQKISLAAYSQIIATDSRFKLPDANKNTLDFLQSQASNNTFYNQVSEIDSALMPNTEALIKADKNLVKNNGSIVGQYLLYNLSGTTSYRLTLNEDLTGKLESGNFTTPLKWIQEGSKITLNFPVPVETGEIGFNGRLTISSGTLDIDTYSNYSFTGFTLTRGVIYSDGSQGYAYPQMLSIEVFNTAKFVPATAEKIVGEWMSNYGNYQFNTDNTSLYKTYNAPNQVTTSSWSVDNNKLVLKENNVVKEEIYLLSDLGVGYSYLKISNSQMPFRFSTGFLIKQQSNVQLKKSDFVGRWIDKAAPIATNVSVRVMSSDNLFFTNFGAWPAPWSSNDGSNSWERNVYLLNNQWVSSCDLSAGTHTDCKLYRNYADKVIAVNGDQYYSLHAEKVYANSDEPPANYSLVQSTRLPEITYFGQWIADGAFKVFYQKTSNGIKVWNFVNNQLIIDNKSLVDSFFPGGVINFSLTNNRLQYTRDNVARELMLVSASENGLTVCEYNQGASCVVGTEFLLSNRSPAKISLKVEGLGTVSPFTTGNPDAVFGNTINFELIPDAGALVKSVTGCGGQLNGNHYVTAEIRDACTITVNFKQKLSVEAKITDPGLASCLDALNETNITLVTQLNCQNDVVGSLEGIQNLSSLNSLTIPKLVSSNGITVPEINSLQKLTLGSWNYDVNAPTLDVTSIDVSRAKNIYELKIENTRINSINLNGLNALQTIYFTNNPLLEEADLSKTKLMYVQFYRSSLKRIFLPAGGSLLQLNLTYNQLSELDLSTNPNLTSLSVDYNQFTNLDTHAVTGLTILSANYNQLVDLDLSKQKSLWGLSAEHNQLSQIDLSNNNELHSLNLSSNQLTQISLTNLKKLTTFHVSDNQISNIDLSAVNELNGLSIGKNKLTTLAVGNLVKLRELYAPENKLVTISGLENISNQALIWLYSNSFDASTLAYLNNLKENYPQFQY